MIKKIPWILSCLALLAILYLFVLLIDAGVALDDARSYSTHLQKRNDLALLIIRKDWIGKSAVSVDNLAKELERKDVIVSIQGDEFNIGQFIFKISDGFVVDVRYID